MVGGPSGGDARRIDRDDQPNHKRPRWAPDGVHLAYEAGQPEQAINIACAQCRLPDSSVYVASVSKEGPAFRVDAGAYPAWSPDGRWLAYDSLPSGDLTLVALATGLKRTLDVGAYHDCVVWSADSTMLASISPVESNEGTGPGGAFQSQEVRVVRLDGERLATLPTDIATGSLCPAFSPASRTIAFRGDDTSEARLQLAEVDGGHPQPIDGNPCSSDSWPAWTGSHLAFARQLGTGSCQSGGCNDLFEECRTGVWLADVDGSGSRLLAATESDPAEVVWSDPPDGLAYVVNAPQEPCDNCNANYHIRFVDLSGKISALKDEGFEEFQPVFAPARPQPITMWFDNEQRPQQTSTTATTTPTGSTASPSTSSTTVSTGAARTTSTPNGQDEARDITRSARRARGSQATLALLAVVAASFMVATTWQRQRRRSD
jgi:Tol biopolymer transport system component